MPVNRNRKRILRSKRRKTSVKRRRKSKRKARLVGGTDWDPKWDNIVGGSKPETVEDCKKKITRVLENITNQSMTANFNNDNGINQLQNKLAWLRTNCDKISTETSMWTNWFT